SVKQYYCQHDGNINAAGNRVSAVTSGLGGARIEPGRRGFNNIGAPVGLNCLHYRIGNGFSGGGACDLGGELCLKIYFASNQECVAIAAEPAPGRLGRWSGFQYPSA